MSIRAVHVGGRREGELDSGVFNIVGVDSSQEILDRLDDETGVDCIVCEYDLGAETGLEVLRAVREAGWSHPFILITDETDGDIAIAATRADVTEYVSRERLQADGERLEDRITAIIRDQPTPSLSFDTNAIAELTRITANKDAGFDEKVEGLLELGCSFLDLDIGFLSHIEDDTHTITHSQGSDNLTENGSTPLVDMYCRRTIESTGLLDVYDAEAQGWGDDPAYTNSGWSCYLGGRLEVDDELYGTLCFADEDPRNATFSQTEQTFIELLTEWLSYELDRHRQDASLRRYKAIHETVQQMVFVIGEGATLELLTEPLATRFGYDPEKLRGESVTTFLSGDAVTAGYEAFEELNDAPPDASRSIETTLTTTDGESVPVEIELSLLSPSTDSRGLVGVIHDRSDLVETKAELAAERDRFRYLFEHIPDPVIITEYDGEGDGIVRAANPAFESVFGYSETEAKGQRVTDLIVPPNARDGSLEIGAQIRREGSVATEVQRDTIEGYRRFLFRGFKYELKNTDHAFSIYTDVTEQTEREQYLKVVNRILRHNLRNDLSIITGFADVLSDDLDDPALRNHAEIIESTANGLADLTEKANDMARIVGKRSMGAEGHIDLAELVEDLRSQLATTNPDLEVVVDLSEPCRIRADSRLSRVLQELATNAIEHSETAPPRIVFDLRTDDCDAEYVTLAVTDDGPGIPEADRERILGEREITQVDHAQGIGLWLVKWLTESYGGNLDFEVDEAGTTVLLELPRYDSKADGA